MINPKLVYAAGLAALLFRNLGVLEEALYLAIKWELKSSTFDCLFANNIVLCICLLFGDRVEEFGELYFFARIVEALVGHLPQFPFLLIHFCTYPLLKDVVGYKIQAAISVAILIAADAARLLEEARENRDVVGYWTILLIATCALQEAVLSHQRTRASADIGRKVYHAVAVLLFYPVFRYKPEFLKLCVLYVLQLFLIIEQLRYWYRLDLITRWMQRYSRGGKEAAFSHVYLLIGNTVSIYTDNNCYGMIVLGFGDLAASVIGMRFGRHKISPDGKTVEGSAAQIAANATMSKVYRQSWNIVASVVSAGLEIYFYPLNDNLFTPAVFAVISRLVE